MMLWLYLFPRDQSPRLTIGGLDVNGSLQASVERIKWSGNLCEIQNNKINHKMYLVTRLSPNWSQNSNTFSTRSKSKTCTEPRYRRSDSRLCTANLESRKKTRGERDSEGMAFGISFKKVLCPLCQVHLFLISNLSESLGFGLKSY